MMYKDLETTACAKQKPKRSKKSKNAVLSSYSYKAVGDDSFF